MKNKFYLLKIILPFIVCGCLGHLSYAQTQTFNVDFESDIIGQQPSTAPGNGSKPTTLNGQSTELTVQSLIGNVGNSTASGNIVVTDVAAASDFRLMDFEGLLSSGIVSSGTVRVAFDFLALANNNNEGFAFLRNYDETEESFADIGFSFSGNTFTIFLLDYDPITGNYLGQQAPAFPANQFAAGTWYRMEAIIDLDNNQLRLEIDGTDYGVTAGISRATGDGYAGAFYNWGFAFAGSCAIDNFSVTVPDKTLPPAPAGFANLLIPNDYNGTANVIRIPDGDFRNQGLDWENSSSSTLYYNPIYDGVSTYKVTVNSDMDEADARLFAFNTFSMLPNRTYEVSALIRTDFPRATWEVNYGLHGAETNGNLSLGGRYGGLPAITQGPDGWERWTWRVTPHWDQRFTEGQVFLGFHEYGPGFDGNMNFEIADLAMVELAAMPLTPFAPGDGVTFPGGSGDLDMIVKSVVASNDSIVAEVTGAKFIFDRAAGTLEIHQQIDMQRLLGKVDGLSLTNLAVLSQSPDLAILQGDDLTIGIQMDGMLVISPHTELSAQVESIIGGDFNRIENGDLFSQDDFGGFTTNIYVPKGTGRLPRMELITPGVNFDDINPDDLTTLGAAAPGWQAQLDVSPGERLFLSAFPSRPYDWEKSFDHQWGLSDYNQVIEYDNPEYMDNWILWNINQRGWAMSFGEQYVMRNDVPFQDHIDAINAEGDLWSSYFSQWFYYNRDAQEWTDEAKRWRDTYGMGAIYSDGLAQDDWLSAYEAMRRLRGDVFPGGDIVIHDSYPQSGVPAASFRPFIYAYATGTYMGENAEAASGPEWAWARYAMGQYRKSNAFGVTKGDKWTGVNGVDKYLVALVWGGRGRQDVAQYDSRYIPILNQLKTLWETYGDDPYFFDQYYHPEAQLLTGFEIGRAGMPIINLDTIGANQIEVTLSSWTPNTDIYYTTDNSSPTINSIPYNNSFLWDGEQKLKIRAFRADLDESREAELGEELAVPLPVSLLSFNGKLTDKQQVLLEWRTNNELNNEGFEVQRSTDGKAWTFIGFVGAQSNTAIVRNYQFLDEQPAKVNYYRLKQIDFDGSYEFSRIVSVRLSDELDINIYPNPVEHQLFISGALQQVAVSVTDVLGKVIYQADLGNRDNTIDMEAYPAGIYHVSITDRENQIIKHQKIIKEP